MHAAGPRPSLRALRFASPAWARAVPWWPSRECDQQGVSRFQLYNPTTPHQCHSPTRHQPPPPRPAAIFNQFYTECQVVGSPEEESRLLLCEATARTMRACFHLLGIHVPKCRI